MLAKLVRPKRILEIGTLAGYSTLWLAKALEEGGKLITIEREEASYQKAISNFAFAKKEGVIEPLLGDATQILSQMVERGEAPFDLVFIDADKGEYSEYIEPVIQLTRSNGVILCDNLIPRRGEVGVCDPRDNEAIDITLFNQMIAQDPRLESLILPTLVGEKGRIDGLGIALVK